MHCINDIGQLMEKTGLEWRSAIRYDDCRSFKLENPVMDETGFLVKKIHYIHDVVQMIPGWKHAHDTPTNAI